MMKHVVLGVVVGCAVMSADAAEQKHTACISNYGYICNLTNEPVDVFLYCQPRPSLSLRERRAERMRQLRGEKPRPAPPEESIADQWGHSVCGVHTETGVQFFPYQFSAPYNVKSGGKCGWATLDIF